MGADADVDEEEEASGKWYGLIQIAEKLSATTSSTICFIKLSSMVGWLVGWFRKKSGSASGGWLESLTRGVAAAWQDLK